jgi:hypothetical protein
MRPQSSFPTRFLAIAAVPIALGVSGAYAARQAVMPLKSAEEKIVAPFDVASLNRVGLVALTGDPGKLGGFTPAFDRKLDTSYEAKAPGPVQINLAFSRPQPLRSIRLLLGETPCEWSLAAAESAADLERPDALRVLVAPGAGKLTQGWEEADLAGPLGKEASVQALRLTLTPKTKGGSVTLRECNLIGEQTLEALGISVKTAAVPQGEPFPLEVVGFFSGGETRTVSSRAFRWTVTPSNSARLTGSNRLLGLRKGPMELRLQFEKLTAPPLPLEVVDGN